MLDISIHDAKDKVGINILSIKLLYFLTNFATPTSSNE